jgi:signal peptidase I
MKRALTLIFLTAVCIVGFLSIKGTLPFMPIFGSSMEPTLNSGDLLTIKPIDPQDVKVGDIIIYNVPKMVRDYYGYPPIVSHRVTAINTSPSLGFRTKGDNTGEDPFTVRPMDIRGTVGDQIPYIGLPLLFFQSQQGLIFVIIGLILLAIFLYGSELSRGGSTVHRGIFAPVINEEKRSNRLLTRKIDVTEKKMEHTEQALEKFATAIAEYAQHLASHTSAIKSLAEASHELKKSAAEQNKVISYLIKNMEQAGLNADELTTRTAQAAHEAVEPAPKKKEVVPAAVKATPGCARRRPVTAEETSPKRKKPRYQA